ncbi:MAG: substrate-binding domain-containing protein [Gemmatimonadetes bacterium]|nr:substrate-binding domain-containing protein [Gemmatimonadota bacterium]
MNGSQPRPRPPGGVLRAALCILALAPAGDAAGAQAPSRSERARPLILASTTSTEDSGLFDELIPAFERAHPQYDVKVIAVGSGQALELGKRQDADVLLVHAPAAESAFVAQGYGLERRQVMYNDFVVVGPPADPAGVRGAADAAAALRRIAAASAPFISRGDASGTHQKERQLWQAARLEPVGAWYRDAGQGMGEVLSIASEKQAYTLTDRATYLALQHALLLEVLLEGDPRLFNPYGVIPVSGARNLAGARAFAAWITGREGQALIGRYGVARFGQPLFVPNAQPSQLPPARPRPW